MKSRIKTSMLLFLDLFIIYCSYVVSLIFRFDGNLDSNFRYYFSNLNKKMIIPILIIFTLFFIAFKMYSFIMKHVSLVDLIRIFAACSVSTAAIIIFGDIISTDGKNVLPMSVYAMSFLLIFVLISLSRSSYRVYDLFKNKLSADSGSDEDSERVLIYGAGEGGTSLLDSFEREKLSKVKYNVVAFYDDDVIKDTKRIKGKKIYGTKHDLTELCRKLDIDEIVIAIPSATNEEMAQILERCKKTDCKLRRLPSIIDLINYDNISIKKIRDVNAADLLGRKEVQLDIKSISDYLHGEAVLVTGGGGSIGSELCRQIMGFNPKKLIIFDVYENTSNDLYVELCKKYSDNGDNKIEVRIGSVRDKSRLKEVFEEFKPGVVFHAAAHKHVPLMESSPKEAIKNNVFGTYNVAKISSEYGVKKFVLISTDKAVNPTNVMGATKRIAELIVTAMDCSSETDYVAVRFGNVLGSNGSVVPLFIKQIEEGGPVTVTHPEITRFFMTIPEAAKLVIQAGAMAVGGEIFILDMGKPVKILDFAEDVIRLSGFEPYKDIDIVFTGLRPGEKLYEELMLSEEGVMQSTREGIFIAKPVDIGMSEVDCMLDDFDNTLQNDGNIIDCIKRHVPTFKHIEN